MSELDDFRSGVLARQIDADKALIRGDAEPRIALWSQNEPLSLMSAGGEWRFGYSEIRGFFRQLAARFSDGCDFTFDLQVAEISGDLAYSVGFERYRVAVAGAPLAAVELRATHVYRREEGGWKIVHRHGDAAAR